MTTETGASADIIRDKLRAIESEKSVEVLYAAEAGSRAWGIDSPDSDYDIRFIYRQPVQEYLTVEEPRRDVIERADGIHDLDGWDLRKALKLFRKSNPSLLEWIVSPTVYVSRCGLQERLLELAREHASGAAAIYHYYHMAKHNYREYLLHRRVKIKKYLYVVRPLLAVAAITENGETPPPVSMARLLKTAGSVLMPDAREAVENLIKRKRAGEPLDDGDRIGTLNRMIEAAFSHYDHTMKQTGWAESYVRSKLPPGVLDKLFRSLVDP